MSAWKEAVENRPSVYIVAQEQLRTRKQADRMEKYTIPEITNESEWQYLTGQSNNNNNDGIRQHPFAPIKPKQILLVDIFSSWSGPCAAMESHLRRMRLQFVETPDCLALAKACCDDIEELKPFKSDPRPTFLFWARGRPVALLRGANRPLLTQLIEQEVETEVREKPRDPQVDIDYTSGRVIQCQGDLARLDDDEVVHSIGSGSTDMLTSFFQDPPFMSKKRSVVKKDDEDKAKNGEKDAVVPAAKDTVAAEVKEMLVEPVKTEEEEEEEDGKDVNEDDESDDGPSGEKNSEIGSKKSGGKKSGKKLETGLLKEIMDAKHSKIFGGI